MTIARTAWRLTWTRSLPLLLALAAIAASPASRGSASGALTAWDPPRTKHVIIISVDGLRPDAIAAYHLATLERLASEGATSLEARTILPSVTLPSHASMVTGVEPRVHGVTWNDDRYEGEAHLKVPSIFAILHGAGLQTAAFFGKSKLQQLAEPGTLDHEESPPRGYEVLADRVATDVARFLATGARPNLLFIHLADTDRAGHTDGWMSPAYHDAAERVDLVVEELVQAADSAFGPGEYALILTADHGGRGRTHGSSDARDVNIPWIAWGRGARRGHVLPPGIRTTDTAATALWLLGVAIPSWMTGKPVVGAFSFGEESDSPSPVPAADSVARSSGSLR
jgi:arylsulfatase A-like enzyme